MKYYRTDLEAVAWQQTTTIKMVAHTAPDVDMNKSLKVLAIQVDIAWHQAEVNRQHIDESIRQHALSQGHDLIVLPEMLNSGFTMKAAEVAETMDGDSVSWMKKIASDYDCAVCGTLVIRDQKRFYNRFIWANPRGDIQHYDKRHLFSMAGEDCHYTPGTRRLTINYLGWRVRPIVCYDLRFPVWCRRTTKHNYDVLVCPANWPSPRHKAWTTLLQARAIENQCYVIGVNRIGTDGYGKSYLGSSAVIDAKGATIANANSNETAIQATLDISTLEQFRQKFPVIADADSFELIEPITSRP